MLPFVVMCIAALRSCRYLDSSRDGYAAILEQIGSLNVVEYPHVSIHYAQIYSGYLRISQRMCLTISNGRTLVASGLARHRNNLACEVSEDEFADGFALSSSKARAQDVC